MTDAAVVCRGLVKRYDDVIAVDGLDLEIRAGECFGLLGPNGAGKTTTVEMLLGIRAPDAGSIEILGLEWGRDARALREHMGCQLQETRLPDKLRVQEVVELFRSFYREGVPVDTVLEQVQLLDKRRAFVKALSGGQRQRLAVATALVSDPALLVLDEPTTGLDPQARLQLWEIINGFKARGRTVLLTTHYMEEAHRLCDRVGIVDYGKMMTVGTPGALIASLGAEHVVEFAVTDEHRLDDARLRAVTAVADVRREDGRIRMTVETVHRAIPSLLDAVADMGVDLTELTTHHATLEDVFISLTGRNLRDE